MFGLFLGRLKRKDRKIEWVKEPNILAVALRVWARRIQKIGLELNDYLIVLGLIFTLACVVQYIYSASLAIRLRGVTLPYNAEQGKMKDLLQKAHRDLGKAMDLSANSTQFNFLGPLFWVTTVTLIRFSVVLLYIRIFVTRSFRLTCYAILTLNTMFFIAIFLSYVLSAIPVDCQWSETSDCSSAINPKLLVLLVAAFSLHLDVTVVALPMPMLWGLQMAVGKKATLSGIFGLGFIICAITAYRVRTTATIGSSDIEDHIRINSLLLFFEPILGVITASLPVMKPVFSKVLDSTRGLGIRKYTSKVFRTASIPVFMRMSQMWNSRSGNRAGREGLDSETSLEDLRRSERGMSASKIRVQRDVCVESASIENGREEPLPVL
ncbi:hypothetical protein BDR22DRAFT_902421 [Usnea florida]